MIGCAEAKAAIAELVSGEIDGAVREEVERHLATCRSCSGEAGRIVRLLDRLAAEEVPDPGPAYWAAFRPRLRRRIDSRRRRGIALPLAAAAALLVGIVLLVHRRGDGAGLEGRDRAMSETRGGAAVVVAGEKAEARSEALLARAAAQAGGREELQAILDEMVPGDPLEVDEGLAVGPGAPDGGADEESGT